VNHLSDHWYELFVFISAMIGAIGTIVQAVNKRAKKKAALQTPIAQSMLQTPIGQSMAQVNARIASTVAGAPRPAPIVPPAVRPGPAAPVRRVVSAGLAAVPIIAQPVPSDEGLLVSGLFTQPRSLVAAFVASEILGPPVAFRHH
jgi:hypothetical protein